MNMENNIQKTAKKEGRPGFWGMIVLIIFFSSFFGAVFGFMAGGTGKLIISRIIPLWQKIPEEKKPEVIREKIIEDDSVIINLAEKSSPAVVSIVVTKDIPQMRNFFNNQFSPFDDFGFFFNPFGNPNFENGAQNQKTEKRKIGGGTGFFISANGMIVTNRHVVEDETADYTVVMSDSKEYPAKVLALDPIKDFAIIKIEGSGFPVLEIGDSEALKVGQTVIAIGNSLGEFSNSVSKGIISGLRRDIVAGSSFGQAEYLNDIIQTDTAINPGNSGGPLLDINGRVIGINVAIVQGAENIGFAIPINQVKKAIDQVMAGKKISVPFLGVRYVAIDEQIQTKNNLPFNYGILVVRGESISDLAVIPGSPADKAGIAENDIILEINETKINEKNNLVQLIARHNAGDTVTLIVWRKGETKNIEVTLAEKK